MVLHDVSKAGTTRTDSRFCDDVPVERSTYQSRLQTGSEGRTGQDKIPIYKGF